MAADESKLPSGQAVALSPAPGVHRDGDTEFMRIIASFAVILIHCTNLSTGFGTICNALAHFSVPVFILISGYYMLRTPREISEILRRCGWLFLKLVIWGCAQYMVDVAVGESTWEGWIHFAAVAVSGVRHLWYLYALITLYLFTPVLYVFCANADRKIYRWMLGLAFLFGSVITIALRTERFPLLQEIISKMKVPYLLGFVFLYLLGDYLRRYPPRRPKLYIILGAIGILGTVVWTFFLPDEQTGTLSLSLFAPGNLLAGAGFFVGVKTIWQRCSVTPKTLSMIKKAASYTEGTYLTHMIMVQLFDALVSPDFFTFFSWLANPLKALCVFIAAGFVSWLLKKVPYVRNII